MASPKRENIFMKWFKFYGQDYLSDPKMLSLTAEERSCWITLLCYSSVNDNGMITFLSEDQLMMQAGLDFQRDNWDTTKGVLKKLEILGMIDNDNGMITIKNWNKRQETNLTSYERVKKYREKKRNDNAMITLEEKRIDKNRINISNKTTKKESLFSTAFDEVWQLYPRKVGKGGARKAWDKIKLSAELVEQIKKSVEDHKKTEQWQESPKYIPHLATFLNQERWTDEVEIKSMEEPAIIISRG